MISGCPSSANWLKFVLFLPMDLRVRSAPILILGPALLFDIRKSVETIEGRPLFSERSAWGGGFWIWESERDGHGFAECWSALRLGLPLLQIASLGDVGSRLNIAGDQRVRVDAIGESAFQTGRSLGSVTIESVASPLKMGRDTFEMSGLKSIVIPASVVVLGKGDLFGCGRFEAVTLEGGSTFREIGEKHWHSSVLV
jgi:hypothetical protein